MLVVRYAELLENIGLRRWVKKMQWKLLRDDGLLIWCREPFFHMGKCFGEGL